MLRFGIFLAGLTLLLLFSGWVATRIGLIGALPSFFYPTLFFLPVMTAIIFAYLTSEKHRGYFIQMYLLLMVVKMIASLGFIIVVVLKDRPGGGGNVTFFLIAYIAFTVAEIGFLYSKINPKKDV